MSHIGKYSDHFLVVNLRRSGADVDAFECIFHKYYPMLLNFLKGMVKDNALAEDIAQNIFVKLWIKRFELDENQSLKNYLYVLARNEAINVLRSRKSVTIGLQSQAQETQCQECPTEEWCNFMDTNAQLLKDIDAMPPQRRTIFKMSRYEHLSNMEIAIRMNLSVRTVEKHIELALKDLRKTIS